MGLGGGGGRAERRREKVDGGLEEGVEILGLGCGSGQSVGQPERSGWGAAPYRIRQ